MKITAIICTIIVLAGLGGLIAFLVMEFGGPSPLTMCTDQGCECRVVALADPFYIASFGEGQEAREAAREAFLTAMRGVNDLYVAGFNVDVPVVDYREIEGNPSGLGERTASAEQLLDKFRLGVASGSGVLSGLEGSRHFGQGTCASILLTRQSFGPVLGIAIVGGNRFGGGICSADGRNTLVINRDSTQDVFFTTLAHELGHSFGAPHDGEGAAINCASNQFIMAATVTRGVRSTNFSDCSFSTMRNGIQVGGRCVGRRGESTSTKLN